MYAFTDNRIMSGSDSVLIRVDLMKNGTICVEELISDD